MNEDGPLKIGMVCYPTHGGSGAVATELGRKLAERGHTVHFISYSRPFRLAAINHPNIHHHEIDTMDYPLFLGPLYGISTSVRIRDIIREAELDILHVHYALPHAVCAYLANEMLSPDERVPVLTTLHGTDITLIGNQPAFQPAVKLGLDKSDGLTCVSRWLSDKTCEFFDICDPLNVIYNFIDAEIYKPGCGTTPRSEFASPDEPIFLHVSNFRPVKRIADVIRVFAEVCRQRPSRLLLVGDGPDLGSALQLAQELKVAPRVTTLGERDDAKSYFDIADIFLFPSQAESFGLAAAEALAFEVPVVGANAGGLPEVVRHGHEGLLYEVGDVDAMAAGALELVEDPERRAAMGRAGRERVIQRFSPEKIIPLYENCYYALCRAIAAPV